MNDNSAQRLHEVFFYGLYMDPEILKQRQVEPRNPRIAVADNFRLRIGNRATLIREDGATAHGLLYSLNHAEIHSLYWGAGLIEYAAEAIQVSTDAGMVIALCCNLIEPPEEHETNAEYQNKLQQTMERLGVAGS